MTTSVSRQAAFIGVRDGNAELKVSRQAAFVGARDANHELKVSRQAAFVGARDATAELYVSRQAAFVGVRPNPVPYPPNLQFRPSGLRLALDFQPEVIVQRPRIGLVTLKAKIPVTFVIT